MKEKDASLLAGALKSEGTFAFVSRDHQRPGDNNFTVSIPSRGTGTGEVDTQRLNVVRAFASGQGYALEPWEVQIHKVKDVRIDGAPSERC